jgi:hypothetical protein
MKNCYARDLIFELLCMSWSNAPASVSGISLLNVSLQYLIVAINSFSFVIQMRQQKPVFVKGICKNIRPLGL